MGRIRLRFCGIFEIFCYNIELKQKANNYHFDPSGWERTTIGLNKKAYYCDLSGEAYYCAQVGERGQQLDWIRRHIIASQVGDLEQQLNRIRRHTIVIQVCDLGQQLLNCIRKAYYCPLRRSIISHNISEKPFWISEKWFPKQWLQIAETFCISDIQSYW